MNREARADLLISGYHGIRCYDETSGTFLRILPHSGEEQEGITFGASGEVYSLVNNLGGGSIVRFSPDPNAPPEYFAVRAGFMPFGLTLAPDGDFLVASVGWTQPGGRVVRVSGRDGSELGDFIKPGAGGLRWPFDLVFSPDGDLLVSELQAHVGVLRFDGRAGAFLGAFVPAGTGGLLNSSGLTFGPDANLYVSSPATDSVLRVDGHTGEFRGEFVARKSGGLHEPRGLRFGPEGRLYVCSAQTHSVLRYDGKTGAFIDEFVTPGSGGLDNGPNFIAFTPRSKALQISLSSEGPRVSWSGEAVVEAATNLAGPWNVFSEGANLREGNLIPQSTAAPMMFFRMHAR